MTLLIPYAGLVAAPWKNGGGCTTEIAIAPPGASLDAFEWRISLATIAASGPFSAFPGVDRTLVQTNDISRMPDFSAVLTVRQLSDLVAFLETLYR